MDLALRNSSHEDILKPGTSLAAAKDLPDQDLERRLFSLVTAESEATAEIVEHIAEFERRRLFAPKRFPTMFAYCTKTFGYSENAAYLRIYAGRMSLQYPEILDLLRTRRLHLTAIRTVGPHLKPSNYRELLSNSLSKTERELKFLIAEVAPKPEPAEVIRRLPSAPPSSSPAPAPAPAIVECVPIPKPPIICPAVEPLRARIKPLTPERVRFAFTGSKSFLDKVDRVRELLRRKHPAGALEDIFAETIECFLDVRDPARKVKPAKPRDTNPRRRSIPIWIKDIVFKRDGGCCAFKTDDGIRCEERGGLEYDHIVPWAKGGASNNPANVRLLCRSHNSFEAGRAFGKASLRR